MAVTLASLKASFPEFDNIGDGQTALNALLTVKLAEAEAQVDRALFGSTALADAAVMYLTAELVALSPAGMNMKLSKATGETIYTPTKQRLMRAAAAGYRVP